MNMQRNHKSNWQQPRAFSNSFIKPFFHATILMLCALLMATRGYAEPLKNTYVHPDTDLRKYTQFLLKPLNLSNTRIVPPEWVEDSDPRQWKLSDNNIKFLTAIYADSMKKGLEESGEFNVVEQPFRGTLELEVTIIALSPYAPTGKKVQTKGFGELTFEAALRDARTGTLLALFEGTQQVGEEYQENTEFNKGHNFADHFKQWGRNVSARMTMIHNYQPQ